MKNFAEPNYPRPSARARELVRGAYDLHVHTSPDIMPRSASDLELAHRCRQWGLAGFVIKSHYVPTAERAALVRSLVPDVDVLGALVLNCAVGGMNTMAVEIAAREGARIVWMPTFDSVNEMSEQYALPPGAKRPQWARLQQELRDQGVKSEPVRVVNEQHQVLPEVRSVLGRSSSPIRTIRQRTCLPRTRLPLLGVERSSNVALRRPTPEKSPGSRCAPTSERAVPNTRSSPLTWASQPILPLRMASH